MASLRPDPLGKALGQMLLSYEIKEMPLLSDIKNHGSQVKEQFEFVSNLSNSKCYFPRVFLDGKSDKF